VDLANRKVIGRYPVGHLPDGLAVGDDALWVVYDADVPPFDEDKLTRIPLGTPLSTKSSR
jgi:hypothetical protein